jgi:hypothetical protein
MRSQRLHGVDVASRCGVRLVNQQRCFYDVMAGVGYGGTKRS